MFKDIKEKEVKFPEYIDISPECLDFIKRLLIKKPKKRFGYEYDA